MKEIHLNCDLGEGGKHDEVLMPYLSACNIACGGHAGTVESMQHTVDLAMEHAVEIGAHPSYPEKNSFGRISMKMEPEDLRRSLIAQIMSLKQIAEAEGAALVHVKPHGALYHDAQNSREIASVILEAVDAFDDELLLYAPENSVLADLAEGTIPVVYEGFADRNYQSNGALVPRSKPGAVIDQKQEVYEHVMRMLKEKKIRCLDGSEIPCHAQTYCLHSDTAHAVEILKYLHQKFQENNIEIL